MRQVNSFIKQVSAMIRKQVSVFGKSEKLEKKKKNSVQLNKNLFSVLRYGFLQNLCHSTCMAI